MSSNKFIRIFYQKLGGHMHMRVFVGTGSKSGDLCVRDNEWMSFKAQFKGASVEFIDETPGAGE